MVDLVVVALFVYEFLRLVFESSYFIVKVKGRVLKAGFKGEVAVPVLCSALQKYCQ